MAFDADCGVPTVLERPRVTITVGYLTVPVVLLVAQASRLHVQPGRPHHKTPRIGLSLRCGCLASWAANPKSEIHCDGRHS